MSGKSHFMGRMKQCRKVTLPERMSLVMAYSRGQAGSLNEETDGFSRW